MSNGILISFEGLDKVGKSTQVDRLIKYLKERRHVEPILVREPGSTEAGERIRSILADPALKGRISPLCEFMLYSASRAQLVNEVIKPMLDEGRLVIADRYYDSSSAYQGYGRGIDLDFISMVNARVTRNLMPDLTILLYVEKFTAESRKKPDRFAPTLFDDRIEQEFMDFRKKVQQGFLDLSQKEPERFLAVNASEKRDQIAKKIAARVDSLIKAWQERKAELS
jgi:dTMP kinase